MKIRKGVALVALVVASGGLALVGTGAAQADTPDCKTVSATMDRPDSRPGGFWADDSFSRTATVCRLPQAELKSSVQINTDQYSVSVVDEGTFKTKGAISFAGHSMVAGVVGSFKGNLGGNVSFTGTVTAPHDWGYWKGSNPGNLGSDEGTSAWIGKLWTDGASLNEGAHWGWKYETCNEVLVNASAGNHGDITGLSHFHYDKCVGISYMDQCGGGIVVIFTNAGGLDVYGKISGKDDYILVKAGEKVNALVVSPTDHKVDVTVNFKVPNRDKTTFTYIPLKRGTHTWVKSKDCVQPSASPSASGSGAVPPPPGDNTSLPVTGFNVWAALGAAAILGVGGYGLIRVARKRRIKFTA